MVRLPLYIISNRLHQGGLRLISNKVVEADHHRRQRGCRRIWLSMLRNFGSQNVAIANAAMGSNMVVVVQRPMEVLVRLVRRLLGVCRPRRFKMLHLPPWVAAAGEGLLGDRQCIIKEVHRHHKGSTILMEVHRIISRAVAEGITILITTIIVVVLAGADEDEGEMDHLVITTAKIKFANSTGLLVDAGLGMVADFFTREEVRGDVPIIDRYYSIT